MQHSIAAGQRSGMGRVTRHWDSLNAEQSLIFHFSRTLGQVLLLGHSLFIRLIIPSLSFVSFTANNEANDEEK